MCLKAGELLPDVQFIYPGGNGRLKDQYPENDGEDQHDFHKVPIFFLSDRYAWFGRGLARPGQKMVFSGNLNLISEKGG
jgi:hypothetical protein